MLLPLPWEASFHQPSPSLGWLYILQISAQGIILLSKAFQNSPQDSWFPYLTDLYGVLCEYICCSTDHIIPLPSCLILKPWMFSLSPLSHLVNHCTGDLTSLIFLDPSLPLFSWDHCPRSYSSSCSSLPTGPPSSGPYQLPIQPSVTARDLGKRHTLLPQSPLAAALHPISWQMAALSHQPRIWSSSNAHLLLQPHPTHSHSSQQAVSPFCTSAHALLFMGAWSALSFPLASSCWAHKTVLLLFTLRGPGWLLLWMH